MTGGYALLAAAWILLSDRLLDWIADPALALRLSTVKGLVFVALTAVLLAVALHGMPARTPIERKPYRRRRWPWPLLARLAALVGVIALVGVLAIRGGMDRLEREELDDLQAMAGIKADGVARWVAERRSDATVFAADPLVAQSLSRWLAARDPADGQRLSALLDESRGSFASTRASLLDPAGHRLLSAGSLPVAEPDPGPMARQLLQSGQPRLEVVERQGESRALTILAPILPAPGQPAEAVAVFEFGLDDFVAPFVRSWPMPREQGKLALARHTGGRIELLVDPAAGLGWPAAGNPMPERLEATLLAGHGTAETADALGRPILTATAAVDDTDWVVLAEIEHSALLGDIGRLAAAAGALTLLCILVAATWLELIWQRGRLRATARATRQAEALEAAEARFRATFEQAAVGIMHVGTDGRIVDANARLCEMLGYAHAELTACNIKDLAHPDQRAEVAVILDRAAAGTLETYRAERRYRRCDGTYAWGDVTVSLVRDGPGRAPYLLAVCEDISAQRAAEEARRQSEERFAAVFRISPAAIFVGRLDDFTILDVNEAWVRLTGFTREEVTSRRAPELGLLADPEATRKLTAASQPPGPYGRYETQLRRKSGEVIDAEITVSAITVDGARCYLGILRDVTEERRAREAIRLSHDQMRRFIDQAPVAIAMFDRDMRYLANSKRWTEEFTPAEGDLTGRSHYEVFPDTPERWKEIHRRALAGELRADDDDRWDHPDGSTTWLRWAAHPWFDQIGHVGGIIISAENISAKRQAELALLDSEARLRLTLDAAQLVAWEADLETGAIERIGGQPEVPGSRKPFAPETVEAVIQAIHPADRERVQREIGKAIAEHRRLRVEYRFAADDTSIEWLESTGEAVYDAAGRPLRLLGISGNVTLRKQQEDQLRLAATVFRSTHEGVVVTDPTGAAVAVNPAFTTITGYGLEDVRGRNMRFMQSGRQDEAFYREMWRAIAEQGYWRGEIWNRRKSGEAYPEWLTISAVHDDPGEVTGYVGVFSDITRIKESESRLEHLAHFDPLTDLPNRLLLLSRLDSAIAHGRRSGRRGAVLFLDLDRFKLINDSLGHPAGDALLVAAAQRLGSRLRECDTLGRLHGDEFVVVLEDLAGPEQAARVAEALMALFAQPFALPEQPEVYASVSIGIAIYPDDGQSSDELIRCADAAMYDAKAAGRGVYRFFTDSLTRAATERLQLESRLRRALQNDELVVHYQPQVVLADRRINGVEALVRWQDPERGLIPPNAFIPLAEETGLIVPLGERVLRLACAQMKDWCDRGVGLDCIAVNLSPNQFRQPNIVDRVRTVLDETGLLASRLELEITEGVLMEGSDHVVEKLEALRRLGVRVAIDDFGTGYSSLAYLKTFPIDRLKVDQRFVRGIGEDPKDGEIAAAIIGLGKILKFEVIGEGVETEAQLDFLHRNGCDGGQGYLFGRPVPAGQIDRLLGALALESA